VKKVITLFKKRIDWFLICSGVYLFIYGIFGFEHVGGEPFAFRGSHEGIVHAYGYYYADHTKISIAIGMVLCVVGTLLYREKKR